VTAWGLTIDCHRAAVLVPFWSAALGYVAESPPNGFDTWNDWYRSVGVPQEELDLSGDGTDRLIDPAGRGPRIWFQPVPEAKAGKNRLHLDLYVSGGRSVQLGVRRQRVDARVAELVALGANVDHAAESYDHYFVVMHDPEGNEFCVA
jgi:Glyoxalase-like domain